MLTNALKRQKTSGGLGNLYVNDQKNGKKRIEMGILYLVSSHFQKLY